MSEEVVEVRETFSYELEEKSVFDRGPFYKAADILLAESTEGKESRYKPDAYKCEKLPLLEIPFIKDASVAVVYFVRQLLCVIAHLDYSVLKKMRRPTEAHCFPLILGLQCFEIDDTADRRRMFDLQFSNHGRLDLSAMRAVREELEVIEARRDLFKMLPAEKRTADPYELLHDAAETASDRRIKRFEEYVMASLGWDKKFISQLIALEMDLYGIRLHAVPTRNNWALDNVDDLLRNQLLDLLEFAASLSKQPAEEAAKYICMWSTVLFRVISRGTGSVEKALKNFPDLYVSITSAACTTKSYNLPLEACASACRLDTCRATITVTALEILSQAGNSKAVKLLKRSRKLCYVDALRYCGMMALRLALEASNTLMVTVNELFDMVLEGISAEYSVTRTCGVRHTCHLLKLLLRDFSGSDACDSWMYARALASRCFTSLSSRFHNDFICLCCYLIDPEKRPGAGVWAIKYCSYSQREEESLRTAALAFRRKCNLL